MTYPNDFVSVYERKLAAWPVYYGEPGTNPDEVGKILGIHHKLLIETFENGYSRWYFSTSEWQRMSTFILEGLLSGRLKPAVFRRNVIRNAQKALDVLNKNLPALPTLDRKALLKLVRKYVTLQRLVLAWGDPISFTAELAVTKKLDEWLTPSIKDSAKRQEVMAQLIAFEEPSFAMREECELASLAAQNDVEGLKNHARDWVHLAFDYVGPITTYDDFKKRFDELRAENLTDKLQVYKNYGTSIKKEKKALVKQYHISKDAQRLAAILTQTNFVYDLRKSYLTRMTYLFAQVLDRVAEVTDTPRGWLNWLFEQEIFDLLAGKLKPTQAMIAARQKNGLVVYENGTARFVSDKEKPGYLKLLEKEQVGSDVAEITGQAGSPGVATGTVNRIVSPMHTNKMQPGDVLVAPMTTVDFLPAMRLASAIVTDIGGITSHAAIVARELKIPAVVGTKIATKSLKDGEKIEVDGTKGVVKRIK